jgi:hypothetical protein
VNKVGVGEGALGKEVRQKGKRKEPYARSCRGGRRVGGAEQGDAYP